MKETNRGKYMYSYFIESFEENKKQDICMFKKRQASQKGSDFCSPKSSRI